VLSSTLLFIATATAMRGGRPSARALAVDAVAGAVFSSVLFIVFTRGLGVSLPGLRFPG